MTRSTKNQHWVQENQPQSNSNYSSATCSRSRSSTEKEPLVMAGEWVAPKPSRSDEVLDPEQQAKMAEEIRTHFDSMAPKRPQKPNRSEGPFMDGYDLNPSSSVDNIPEQDKLQALRSQSQPMSFEESDSSPQEEFVETQYYTELNSIDKQHHTTGKGFIKDVEGGGDGFAIRLQEEEEEMAVGVGHMTTGFASNPATNEWIPSTEEEANLVSSKPNRSEGSG